MRATVSVLGIGLAMSLAGCSSGASAGDPVPPVQVVQVPAGAAGGACILLDYPLIEQHTGIRFDVAAADQADDTSTCVLQAGRATRPDLVLSVVERTSADTQLFLAEVKPAKATAVKGLGRAAYRLVQGAGADRGPSVEVGWLTHGSQLMTLRFTFAPGAEVGEAERLAGAMVKLADVVDGDDPVDD